jgi:putative hemolysin
MPNNNQAAEKKIVKRTDGSLLVEGHMPFHELAHYLDLSPVEGGSDFQTAGGFMMEQLGKIPKEGEFIKIDHYKFEVVDMDRHRVDKILVKKLKLKSGHPK